MSTEVTPDDIFDCLATTISEELKLDITSLSPSSDLRRLPGLESIKLLRIISRVERHYGVELDEDAIYRATKLDDVVSAVYASLPSPAQLERGHG